MKIDKNIPIPEGRSKYPFIDMEAGDSFYEEGHVQGKLLAAAHNWCKRNGKDWKFSTRSYESGYRIWRIK